MRVPKEQLVFLKELITKKIKDVEVYLFGSRVDDELKGGDIDILIISKKKISFIDKTRIKYSFFEKYGEQKLDLVNFRFDDKSNFKELILMDAVKL